MRAALAICLLGLVAVVPALTDASPPQALFNQVRAKILNNIARVPRYTCVETIERNMHRPQLGFRPSTCASTIAARAGQSSPGLLTWHDRLRLDVAIVGYAEMFSWAGASAFETGAMDQLAATGATGSGAFSSFLASIFGADADHFQYVGERQTPFGLLSTFEYNVPVGKSHYQTRMGDGKDRIIGYHGAFYVIPATATLRRLEVVAEPLQRRLIRQAVLGKNVPTAIEAQRQAADCDRDVHQHIGGRCLNIQPTPSQPLLHPIPKPSRRPGRKKEPN